MERRRERMMRKGRQSVTRKIFLSIFLLWKLSVTQKTSLIQFLIYENYFSFRKFVTRFGGHLEPRWLMKTILPTFWVSPIIELPFITHGQTNSRIFWFYLLSLFPFLTVLKFHLSSCFFPPLGTVHSPHFTTSPVCWCMKLIKLGFSWTKLENLHTSI